MHRTSITAEAPRFILKVVSGSYLSRLQPGTAGMSGVLLSRQLKMEPSENVSVGVDPEATPTPAALDTAVLLLGAGVTAVTHPLLYVKLLIQVANVAKQLTGERQSDITAAGVLATCLYTVHSGDRLLHMLSHDAVRSFTWAASGDRAAGTEVQSSDVKKQELNYSVFYQTFRDKSVRRFFFKYIYIMM